MDAYQEDLPELLAKYLRTGLCKERRVMRQMEHVSSTKDDRNFSTRHVSNADGLSGRDDPDSDAAVGNTIIQAEDPSTYSYLPITTRAGQAGCGWEPTSDGSPVPSSDVMAWRHRIVGIALHLSGTPLVVRRALLRLDLSVQGLGLREMGGIQLLHLLRLVPVFLRRHP